MPKTFIVLISCFIPCILLGQNASDSSLSKWSFSTSAYYYFIPHDKNAFTLIGYADYKKVHLEARYNYEDLNTVSAFAGWRFQTGEKFQFAITPMLGFAAGNTDGIIPAVEINATYKIFDFYSESEYVVDFAAKNNNFFYTWLELAVSPIEPLRAGVSGQRTRLYKTARDLQTGIFAEYSFWKLTLGAHYFNPFSSDYFVIASLSVDF